MTSASTQNGSLLVSLSAALVWAAAHGALKVYDVGDYVQDGLIAHYDAIRNAGADIPHDDAATAWKDLSAKGDTAEAKASIWGGNLGSWTSDAYVFVGTSYMQTTGKLTLGGKFTIQIACDMETGVITDGESQSEVCTNTLFSAVANANRQLSLTFDRSLDATKADENLYWRTDYYGGISSGNRPRVYSWDGLYVNAAFDAEKMYVAQGDEWITTKWGYVVSKVTTATDAPELQYRWGGYNGKGCGTTGKFHSLRIYSRKLTDDELAWNRAIDEIRFRGSAILPVTNVVVVADALGRCGVDAPGAYAVDGSHSFAAANVSVGGCVYAPAGYSVEEWDAESGAWGEAVSHDGTAYEYSTADSPAKVRLSWRWEMVSGIARYDAGDYVQDGMIAHYDAICNAGADLPHDEAATAWKDLSANGGSAASQTCVWGGTGSWNSDAYVFAGTTCMKMADALTLGSEFTIQIAGDFDMTADGRTRPTLFGVGSSTGAGKTDFQILVDRYDNGNAESMNLSWWTVEYSGITKGNSPQIGWADGRYVNAAFGDGKAYFTAGTAWPTGKALVNATASVPALTYSFGGRYVTGDQGGRNYCSFGKLHALRIYSRKLTDDELAWNRDVDEVRYRGAEPTASGSVWVRTSRAQCAAAESGAYRLKGEYSFTAAEATVGETVYTPVGSVVETWDAAAGAWTNPVYEAGTSRTLREADAATARRLTWKYNTKGFAVVIR